MLILMLILVAAGCAVALKNWRWGIAAAIFIGLLQDPVRKMIPGAPAWLVMVSMPVWASALISSVADGDFWGSRFLNSFPRLARWLQVFTGYLILPAALSASYGTNSWQITLLGAFVYLVAFLVMRAGWHYPASRARAEHILIFYVLLTAIFLIGGPLEMMGLGDRFAAVGTSALDAVWVTYRTGSAVYMRAGFFRGPDVMGWHASLVFMLSTIMAFRSRGAARGAWILLAVWGGLNIWLCGRRKMLAMLPFFLGCYLFLIFRFRNFRQIATIGATALLITGLGWYFISSLYHDAAVEEFYLSTITQAEERVHSQGVLSVFETVRQAGFFGYGLGMSQQGIHNIQADKPRLWQESGPSKMLAELGVPGSLLFLGLGFVLLLTAYQVVRKNANDDSLYLSAGLFAVLIANLASAVVSAQIFGDPLVMFLLTFMAGMLLSGVRVANSKERLI